MNENEFDLEQFQAEFEQEWEEQEQETTQDETEEVIEETEITDEEVVGDEEEVEPEDSSSDEEPETIHDPDADKRNRAFADMRRQLEETKKYEAFLKNLAEQSGTTPEELMNRYEERKIEQEAKDKGVPVDVYKRLSELEQRDVEREQQILAERFNSEVERVIEKENLTEEDVENVFKHMAQEGLIVDGRPAIPFEQAYKLANLETIVEKSKKEAVQDNLEQKRKRQQSSAIPSGASVTPTSNELSDEDVDKILESMDLLGRI